MNSDNFLRRIGESRLCGTVPANLSVRLLPPTPKGGELYIADRVLLGRFVNPDLAEPILVVASAEAAGIEPPAGVRLFITSACFADLCAALLSETEETSADRLVSDLIERRITDYAILWQRLTKAGVCAGAYYYCMVAVPATPSDVREVAAALQTLFPKDLFTVYGANCVGLLFRDEKQYGLGLKFDHRTLEILAERYGLSLGIGNCSEHLQSLYAIYRQSEAAVRFGRIFDPHRRIYRYEDYSMFHIIEAAAAQGEVFGNLIYLCHPCIFPLLRYDRQHDSDIRRTVICYLKNNCSATFTAEELSLHRNTLTYKIRKAEELIGGTLHDVALQERLLFSDRVVEYMEKVAGVDPFFMDNQGRKSR